MMQQSGDQGDGHCTLGQMASHVRTSASSWARAATAETSHARPGASGWAHASFAHTATSAPLACLQCQRQTSHVAGLAQGHVVCSKGTQWAWYLVGHECGLDRPQTSRPRQATMNAG
eukprot:scaffold72659_cov19-Tisochrysis_lutea.AAC.1